MGSKRRFGQSSTIRKYRVPIVVGVIFLFIFLCWGVRQETQNDSETCGVVKQLSTHPRVYLYKNFISEEEAKYIISLGSPSIEPSQVIQESGGIVRSKERTSSGAFLYTDANPILMKVEDKIARWTMIPVEHGESLYLLRYEKGEQYHHHVDFFTGASAEEHIGKAGQRVATVVIYLQVPEEGGATSFPAASLSVKPNVGDAILFYNLLPNGEVDPRAIHAGDPVKAGTKWVITKWIRQRPYENNWYADQQRRAWEQAQANAQSANNNNNPVQPQNIEYGAPEFPLR